MVEREQPRQRTCSIYIRERGSFSWLCRRNNITSSHSHLLARTEMGGDIDTLLHDQEHVETESVTSDETSHGLGSTEERATERQLRVYVLVDPRRVLYGGPLQKVLRRSVTHAVADENSLFAVGLHGGRDVCLEAREEAVALLELFGRQAPVVLRIG